MSHIRTVTISYEEYQDLTDKTEIRKLEKELQEYKNNQRWLFVRHEQYYAWNHQSETHRYFVPDILKGEFDWRDEAIEKLTESLSIKDKQIRELKKEVVENEKLIETIKSNMFFLRNHWLVRLLIKDKK